MPSLLVPGCEVHAAANRAVLTQSMRGTKKRMAGIDRLLHLQWQPTRLPAQRGYRAGCNLPSAAIGLRAELWFRGNTLSMAAGAN